MQQWQVQAGGGYKLNSIIEHKAKQKKDIKWLLLLNLVAKATT